MDTDQGQYIGIDDNRLAHMREVGRLCYELAADILGWDEQRCRQMFIGTFPATETPPDLSVGRKPRNG